MFILRDVTVLYRIEDDTSLYIRADDPITCIYSNLPCIYRLFPLIYNIYPVKVTAVHIYRYIDIQELTYFSCTLPPLF